MAKIPVSGSEASDKKILALSRTAMFGGLSKPALAHLAKFAEWRLTAAGATIFRRGDPGTHLFVIYSGKVKFTAGAIFGRDVTLSILSAGEIFGEVAIADGGPRTADALAVDVVELLVLARRDLIPYLQQEPQAMLQMMVGLAARARVISENYEDAVFLALPTRLAKRLIVLSQHFGYDTPQGRKLAIVLPHRELANHMHVTRESINRLIQKWRRDGIIEEHRGVIVITDIRKLTAEAISG
ncbi:MAG: Crp/Fnr family transcriptional regulator [Rhizomicrobium sp.]|nr:Crp/Fnr family transcriptional regulator [Rhizomicrobium sp.]